jgi:type II secretory pathway pseudopilin PulG
MGALANLRRCDTRRAFTLIEFIIAAGIAVLIGATVMWLLVAAARLQREIYVETKVNERADRIQEEVMRILRRASRQNVVQFSSSDAVPGQGANPVFYYRLIFRQNDNAPNEELRYFPDTRRLRYDPNRAVANNEVAVEGNLATSNLTRIEYFWLASGIQPTGAPDSSVILVQFEVSDAGRTKRSFRNTADRRNMILATRSFAVNLRRH